MSAFGYRSIPIISTYRVLNVRPILTPKTAQFIHQLRSHITFLSVSYNCSSLNSDLFKNHLRDDDKCACGSPETAEHFFTICNNYNNIRATTLLQIQVPFNINILLCGCPLYDNETNREIFDFVHKFIISSRRFD